jgi:hypothetical protein
MVKYQNHGIQSSRVTRFSVVALILFPFFFYLYVPFTTGIQDFEAPNNVSFSGCDTYENWFHLSLYFSIVDLILTILVPFAAILTLNILILIELRKIAAKRRRISTGERMFSVATRNLIILSLSFALVNVLMAYSKVDSLFSRDEHRQTTNLNITQTNITVNKSSSSSSSSAAGSNDSMISAHQYINAHQIVDSLAFNLYYLNFCLNFFLYVLNGPEFRNTLFSLFKNKRPNHLASNRASV